MNEDKLKIILENKYTENPIVNFLLYTQKGLAFKPSCKKLFLKKEVKELTKEERTIYFNANNEWRKHYDLDVIFLEGDLNADTIFSIWIPLKMCLQISNTYPYSEMGNDKKPFKSEPYISNIIKNIDIYLPYKEWEELYKFVSIALTEANVMKLFDRKMQKRGESYYDQMPKTLYECFKGGEFNMYFEDDQFEKWIIEQKITMFFEKEISRENIKPLIFRMEASECEWLKSKEEVKEMLLNYLDILEKRKTQIKLE